MIKTIIVVLGISFMSSTVFSQEGENEKLAKKAIKHFVDLADKQDAASLAGVLDSNFRIVMNQLFGSQEVLIMDRATYLEKIRNKEFGGDKRKLTIHSLNVNGKIASARVTLKGSKMSFISFLHLIQNAEGDWKLVSDMPDII